MVYAVDVYDKNGKVASKFDLKPELFSDEIVNPSLIHEYLLLQQANARNVIASTKTRAEVAGSGRKLYKQKGTGNARVGDKNSPIRRHGGVAFGPSSERNFEKTMTKKARKLALNGLLTLKVKEGIVSGLDLDTMEPNTKGAIDLLAKMGNQNKKVLFVLDKKEDGIVKSFRNIEGLKYLLVDYLNPYDLINAEAIVFLKPALEFVNQA
jgi:50S ribosomal protein L4